VIAEFTGDLSVFAFAAQMLGHVFPHHLLLTFSQRARHLIVRTNFQVVLFKKERDQSEFCGLTLSKSLYINITFMALQL